MAAIPAAIGAAPLAADSSSPPEKITPHLSVARGSVNGVLVEQGGRHFAVYGWPNPEPARIDQVLFTDHRRDVAWAGQALVARGAKAVIPAAESNLLLNVNAFWTDHRTNRFHDYKQQSTHILAESLRDASRTVHDTGRQMKASRVLTEPLPQARLVRGGETLDWEGLSLQVLDTPGCTRGAVSYLFELEGKRIACAGDLIYGDGKILDLYSLQDSIPDVKEDGYHGYAARAADVIASLRRIADWKPDVLIPAHGPVIANPAQAIGTLVQRLQNVFASHFANDALRWYRGEERFGKQVRRILGDRPVAWMPFAETVQTNLPSWIIPINNSRLLLSESGAAFLVDCGGRRILQEVQRLHDEGRFKNLEGLYITHYHDDHTDQAQALVDQFHCPVYACREMRDILEHPGAYRMPALTPNPIRHIEAMADGARTRWHEFGLTFSYFPGQTLYHGGLVVRKDRGETIFFIGDSFVPSGLDDYCLRNRNLCEPAKGYAYCLEVLRKMKPDYLLINQHVEPAFRFSAAQLGSMLENFRQRRELLAELFPWDDPNYGVDAEWARLYPYGSELAPGKTGEWKAVILNHSPSRQTYRVTPRLPAGWRGRNGPLNLTLGPRREGSVAFTATPPPGWEGTAVITADVAFGPWVLREWTEALVTVRAAR